MTPDAALLEVAGLTVQFSVRDGTITVVEDVDLTMHGGEVHAVVGESGSGKSVTALAIMGLRRSVILRRHVVPHILSPLIVTVTILAGVAMIVEAGLSFVGLGAVPPESSWGTMLAGSIRFTTNSPWLIVWPGLCIVITVVCLNLLGDGIKDSVGRETRKQVGS